MGGLSAGGLCCSRCLLNTVLLGHLNLSAATCSSLPPLSPPWASREDRAQAGGPEAATALLAGSPPTSPLRPRLLLLAQLRPVSGLPLPWVGNGTPPPKGPLKPAS